MSTQTDWVSEMSDKERPTRNVRDTRESVANQKARLSLKLHRLCSYCPMVIRSADVFKTRQWSQRQAEAKKVSAKVRASINDYTVAIASLESYLDKDELVRFGQ